MIATVHFDESDVDGFFERLDAEIGSTRSRAILVAISTTDELGDVALDAAIADSDPLALFERTMRRQRILRALETCGKPAAAAVGGSALGVAFEIALACHYRVAAEGAAVRCGPTQVAFGLTPGNGGTQRLARALGFAKAVPLLLESKRLRVAAAREAGLIDALASGADAEAAAAAWLQARLNEGMHVAQPWDVKGFAIPGGAEQSRAGVAFFMAASAMLRERTYGNYPAARDALSCVYEGLQTVLDTALKIESRYFVRTAKTPEARNMLRLMRGAGDDAPQTVAHAIDYVRAIGKMPVAVGDSRGSYTSRVFGTYLTEGLILLADGVKPALIENAGRLGGMPLGPLAQIDDVSIELIYTIGAQTRDTGGAFVEPDAERVLVTMVEKLGRLGRTSGHGFYEYAEDGTRRLWPELERLFSPAAQQPGVSEVVERLIAIQSLEAVRCLERSIVARPIDADVAALLGWGYPAFRGGPIAWIDTLGAAPFAAGAQRLAALHGARFAPPRLLLEAAERGLALCDPALYRK